MSEAVRTMMRMDAEAAQEAAAQADAGFLWDFWYPAARSTEVRGQKLVLAGTGDYWAQEVEPEAAFREVDSRLPVVLLAQWLMRGEGADLPAI